MFDDAEPAPVNVALRRGCGFCIAGTAVADAARFIDDIALEYNAAPTDLLGILLGIVGLKS
jgi:hypothetical protein